jgi:DNA-binding NarL/FixJ family response regulator
MSTGPFDHKVRTLIVEDQGIFREFLKQWLLGQEKFTVVGAAASAEEGLRLAQELQPNFLIADLHLPGMDGLALVRAVRQTRPEIRSLMLTSLTDPLAVTRIRESGVEGYLEKDCTPEELAEAVNAVAAGRTYFSPRFRDAIRREGGKPMALGKILSRREQQVLAQVLEGKTSREIGELVGLSARTVEFHRANLMAKLGSPSPTDLLIRVKKLGLG